MDGPLNSRQIRANQAGLLLLLLQLLLLLHSTIIDLRLKAADASVLILQDQDPYR